MRVLTASPQASAWSRIFDYFTQIISKSILFPDLDGQEIEAKAKLDGYDINISRLDSGWTPVAA